MIRPALPWKTKATIPTSFSAQPTESPAIAINRPERRNAFRPETVDQLIDAFHHAHHDNAIGAIILTGTGAEAFCSGGDQRCAATKAISTKAALPI